MLTFIPSSEQATKYQSYLWNKKIRKKTRMQKTQIYCQVFKQKGHDLVPAK